MTVTLVSVHELAKLMNLTSARRVQQLEKQGVIEKEERGKYDAVRCLSMYVAYLNKWRSPAEIPCSADDLALFLDLTKKQINYLSKIGVIPTVEHGHFDLATGIQSYLSFIRKNYLDEQKKQGRKAPWQRPLFNDTDKN